jgi:UDP-N-acetylmuramate dehydrogenase
LQSLNTLAVPASARALVTVENDEELRAAIAWARAEGLPVVPLGSGSNIVLAGNLPALVVRQAARGVHLLHVGERVVQIRVAAGQNWHALVEWTLAEGFYGLENLALIPGSVGAAPIQNIGAYGVELAPFVDTVHAFDALAGSPVELTGPQCRFGYRDSIFKHEWRDRLIITAVDLRLSRQPNPNVEYPALAAYLEETGITDITPRHIFHAVVAIRASKLPDPARWPNVGSFFKNPVVTAPVALQLQRRFEGLPAYPLVDGRVKLPAAWLIDHCGWKGQRCGGVGVHPEHALVLVNYGGEDGEAVLALAARITDSVAATFDLALEIEPRVYGRAA